MNEDKKTDEEMKNEKEKDMEIRKEARKEALKLIEIEKIRKEEKEKEEKEKLEKKFAITEQKKCKEGKPYYLKIKYKCRSVCGNEYIIFTNSKEEFPFIDKDDLVIYNNPSHINHNKKAVVLDYILQGTGREDISLDKKIPVFDIKFTDKLSKLPFYKIKVNDITINTKKKIVIIKRVNYKHLKLIYSKVQSDYICIKLKDGESIEKSLNQNYKKKNNKKNAKFEFNKFIKDTFKKNLPTFIKDLNSDQQKLTMQIGNNKKKIKISQSYLRNILKNIINYKNNYEKKIKEGETKNDDAPSKLNKDIQTLNKIIEYFDGLSQDKKIYIYIYIYFKLKNQRNIIKKFVKLDVPDEMQHPEHINKIVDIFNKIKDGFDRIKIYFKNKYIESYSIKDEEDKQYIDENIFKIINKNRADIERDNTKDYKEYKLKDHIIDEIKTIIQKKFALNKEFIPRKVFLKYANKDLLKETEDELNDDELNDDEINDKNKIDLNNPNQLVTPTSDKKFTITNIDPIFINENPTEDEYDKFFKNNIKIYENKNLIEVKIDIGLNVKDKSSEEILFEEKIKEKGFINSLRDFAISVQDNFNCEVSKKNIENDIQEIKKKLGLISNTNVVKEEDEDEHD